MHIRHVIGWLLPLIVVMTGTTLVSAQDYPVKPIRVYTSAPGGSSDFVARLVAQGISAPLGQQVIIENRTGATTGGDIVSKAPADGYTLIYWGSTLWTLPLLRQSVPYDIARDFAPVTMSILEPLLLVVHPSLPIKSPKELVALARTRPGDLNYASGGAGSSNHLAAELFKSMAGANIVNISYKGSGGAVIALVGGEVQMMFSTTGAVMAHVKTGRLRALAVTSAKPSALVPGLPTVAAAGLAGYEASQKAGLLAPAKTPVPVINRLNHEVVLFLNKSDVKERFLSHGVEVVANSPEEFAATIKSEMARMGKVIKDANIRDEN